MCQIKNYPIKGRYQNPTFGFHADFCMVAVINSINNQSDCVTVASCCGHGDSDYSPYITVVQPKSKIKEIKDYLIEILGWDVVSVSIWHDLPDSLVGQMGRNFAKDKVYVGYYNLSDEENSEYDFCYTWSDNDLQMVKS